jgi:hypothetical protein
MQLVTMNLTALAVAALFYAWRDGFTRRLHHHKVLRERVTYMLWVAAQGPS